VASKLAAAMAAGMKSMTMITSAIVALARRLIPQPIFACCFFDWSIYQVRVVG
jgi:hypothetical protein